MLKNILLMVDLPPEALVLLVMVAGMLIIVGGLFPRFRALAISILLFVAGYIALDPIADMLEAYLEVTPLWISAPLMVLLGLLVICQALTFLGFFESRRHGSHGRNEDDSGAQERCLGRIIGRILAFPFRALWWFLRSLYRA